jgi:PAS domain S-box-containing protein
MSCFTPGGSFWTNVSSELLALAPQDDPRDNPRNRCIHCGYQSVGLFPVRAGQEIIGLLQLNDRRQGRFTAELLVFYETLTQNIGLALQRTAAQQALRESEEKFSKAFAQNAAGMFITRLEDGRYLDVNDTWLGMFGFRREEVLGRTALELNLWGATEERDRAIDELRSKGGFQNGEFMMRRRSGQIFVTLASAEVVTMAGEKVILGSCLDITERKRVEEALRESEQRFRHLSEHSPDFIALHDLQLRHLYVNPALARLVGRSQEAFVGRSVSEMVVPEAAREIERMLRQALETDAAYQEEFVFPRPDGPRYFLRRSVPLRGADGKTQAILAISTDITERKRAEEALRLAKEQLAQTNANLETLVQQRTAQLEKANKQLKADLAALTRMHALSGRLLEADGLEPLLQEVMEAALAIMGAQKGTLQLVEGDGLRIAAHQGHQPGFLNFFASTENGATVCGKALKHRERVVVPDVETSGLFAGTPSLAMLREAGVRAVQSTPLISRTGALLGVLTTHWGAPYRPDEQDLWRVDLLARQAADLIDRARQDAVLRESEKLLEREILSAVDQERQHLGRELHDGLCQILTATKFKIGLLERKLARKSSVEPAEARALELEINRAMEQARAMAQGLNPVKLVARGLVSALEELAASVRGSGLLGCVCECDERVAVADSETARHLYRIAQEAVHNALKHGKARNIRIQLKELGERISLVVQDDGVGFSPASQPGAGMGLHNMKARAELIGGSLDVQPGGQGGTVVACTLPRPPDESDPLDG